MLNFNLYMMPANLAYLLHSWLCYPWKTYCQVLNKGCEWGRIQSHSLWVRGHSLLPLNWSLVYLNHSYGLYLTLILLKPKVISLCHHYTARPACTSIQSDQTLYWWLTNLKVFTWISWKMLMESAKNGKWIIPFKKLSRLRIN